MTYDGTTPLQPALAELLDLSPKSQARLAEAIKQATGFAAKRKAGGVPMALAAAEPCSRY
jgi:hypothetical protein